MHLDMASALVGERQRDLACQRRAARNVPEYDSNVTGTRTSGRRIPRYRVSWSRTSLPGIGAAGRRERSWVIVISATRGL